MNKLNYLVVSGIMVGSSIFGNYSVPTNIQDTRVFAEEMKSELFTTNNTDKLNVYISNGNDVYIKNTNGDDEKQIKKGSFIGLNNELIIPDAKNDISGRDSLVKVPDNMQKNNFAIEISGTYDNNPVRIYSGPNDKLESSSNFTRPDYIYSNDFTIYNDKFIKINDVNGTYFINLDKCNWNIISDKSFKVVNQTGDDGRMSNVIIPNEKHFTTDINSRTNLTADDLRKITKGTGLEGIEDAVVEVEEQYAVNSLFTLSVAALESSWGRSYFANDRNNLFGICAYDGDEDNSASYFSSKDECVLYWGKLIHDDYFKNGRRDLVSINDIYASDKEWADRTNTLMYAMIAKL